jgi:hypothetical protein
MIENVKKAYEVFSQLDDENICEIFVDYKKGENCDTKFRYYLEDV